MMNLNQHFLNQYFQHLIECNEYLKRSTTAYYILKFYGWKKPNNPDFINFLKNDFNSESVEILQKSAIDVIRCSFNAIVDILKKEEFKYIRYCF